MSARSWATQYTEGFKDACAAGKRPCFGWYEPRYLAGEVAAHRFPMYARTAAAPTEGSHDVLDGSSAQTARGALHDLVFPSGLTSSSFFPSPDVLLKAGALGSSGLAALSEEDTTKSNEEELRQDDEQAEGAEEVLSREQESLRIREAGQTARVFFQWASPSTAEELFAASGGGVGAGLSDAKVPPARDYERLLLDQ